MLTSRFPIVRPTFHTFVSVKPGTTIIVMDREPAATAGTDDQTCEEGSAVACCPHGIGVCAIGLQPCLVALILLWGKVSWTAIGQQDQPLVRGHHHSTGAWSLRPFAARILLPSPVDVGTGVQGVFEHHL
jgi:hypothetical protein